MVDDLITLGTNEPYRMFTSRAEYRLPLREDNADLRLTEIGYQLGIVCEKRRQLLNEKQERIELELNRLRNHWVQPNTAIAAQVNRLLEKPMSREYSLADLLARPGVQYKTLMEATIGKVEQCQFNSAMDQAQQQVEIQIKYQGYIDRQADEIERPKRQENTALPEDFDYEQMQGLSNELKQKLIAVKPENIGRASRIPGMTPAAISLLFIYLKKHQPIARKAS